jgi:hypothetical protein
MSDPKAGRRAAAAALGSLLSGVGQNVADAVRQEAARSQGDPQAGRRAAAAAVSGLVGGVGQNVAELLRQELGAARSELRESARAGARGAGLLGGAAVAGHTAVLFSGIALWRGLGNRIGYARSALVVAALSGGAAAMLASAGREELGRAQRTQRDRKAGGAAAGTDVAVPTVADAAHEAEGAGADAAPAARPIAIAPPDGTAPED